MDCKYLKKEAESRTVRVLGQKAVEDLSAKRVIVFGVGGVGGNVLEALARCGVGQLDLVDPDTVSWSNLNRQLLATTESVGRSKVEVGKERIHLVAPECIVRIWPVFFLPEMEDIFPWDRYDYIVDAIDTVTAKLALARIAQDHHVPIISSMGTGNKLDPSAFEIADIYETSVCPLAKVMRHECKKLGIRQLKVVYSKEIPKTIQQSDGLKCADNTQEERRRSIPGSVSFVPSAAGLLIASAVIRDLAKNCKWY